VVLFFCWQHLLKLEHMHATGNLVFAFMKKTPYFSSTDKLEMELLILPWRYTCIIQMWVTFAALSFSAVTFYFPLNSFPYVDGVYVISN